MPPLPSTLVEEGEEFWRRYPELFAEKASFRPVAYLTDLHVEKLSTDFFPVVGSVPKVFTGKNQRAIDMSIVRFEDTLTTKVIRDAYGLPTPNIEASYLSLAKYAKPILPLDDKKVENWNIAFNWMERHFGPYMRNSRVKSFQEVVDGLDKTTSPGFPWNKVYPTKRELIENWKDFPKYMLEDWDRLRDDDNYTAIFGNSLKEEIRPVEKIASNSIRTFTAGPIEMTIHGNRLFEDMNEKMYASHLKTASVVGFTPLKRGWQRVYEKLKKHKNGFALDESQYDSSLRSYLMWAVCNFRWNMLRSEDRTDDNKKRMFTYYRNLINTLIITADGVFILKQGGNPSGSVNTITDNTLILFALLSYAWLCCAPPGQGIYERFMNEVSLCLCGDDNTWSVSDDACTYFNARSIIACWQEIGVTTTTDSLDPRPVEELDFLSAYTVFVDNVAVPLYNRQKLLTGLLYSRYPGNPCMTLIRACAILRVGWADVPLRDYCWKLISWLVDQYGSVLECDPDWRSAMLQIPTERDLEKLFLGEDLIFEKQSYVSRGLERLKSEIKTVKTVPVFKNQEQGRMSSKISTSRVKRVRRGRKGKVTVTTTRVAMPKRSRAARKAKARAGPSMPKAGPSQPRKRGQRNRMGRMFPSGNRPRKARVCEVTEDEYIGEINGSTGFACTQFPINAGQAATFPWLSKQAAQWEKYRFLRLQFYYKPEVSAFATNGASGKVIFNIDYDASDPAPASKQQAEDTDPHVDCMPYEEMMLSAAPAQMNKSFGEHFVRTGGVPGASDIKTYDVGTLNVSTYGNANTSVIGELHVSYTVLFEVPVLESSTTAPVNYVVSQFDSAGGSEAAGATGVAKTMLLATATYNGLNIVNTAGSFVPTAGNYTTLYSCSFLNTGVNCSNATIALYKNGVMISYAVYAGPNCASISLTDGCFITCNGTDAFTLVATASYGAGTETLDGQLLFQAA